MSAFGNICFLLKTNTVTYIVFEDSSAVDASCRCDYLDKYPVIIRSVFDTSTAGTGSASIETCILEQIEQSSNLLVEEEGQINNFIELLDMENIDDYLELDDKEKNVSVDKPLLEVGNEEIIATESDGEHFDNEDETDVAAIEKQALLPKQTAEHERSEKGFVLVDNKSAKILQLINNTLHLADLPQLKVAIKNINRNNEAPNKKHHQKKLNSKQGNKNSLKGKQLEKSDNVTNTEFEVKDNKSSKKDKKSKAKGGKHSAKQKKGKSKNSLVKEHQENADTNETHPTNPHDASHNPEDLVEKKDVFSASSASRDEEKSKPQTATKNENRVTDSNDNTEITTQQSECKESSNVAITENNLLEPTEKQDSKDNTENDLTKDLTKISDTSAFDNKTNELDSECITSESIPQMSMMANDIVENLADLSSEQPLVMDVCFEPDEDTPPKMISPNHNNNNRTRVAVDHKSAMLLGPIIHDDSYLYIDMLPRLAIKLQHVDLQQHGSSSIAEKQASKSEPIKLQKKVKFEGTTKKKEEKHRDTPRKMDLEKIDSKFLPAGSKIKSQAKAKSKQEKVHKKHIPVPELPIELKAHLNTSFKIPKKNSPFQSQSINRNASELNFLHRDQTREERDKQRKRFQRARKPWDDQRNKVPRPSNPPLPVEKRNSSPEGFDTSFDDTGFHDSSPQQQTEEKHISVPEKENIDGKTHAMDSAKNGNRSFQDIWNISVEKPTHSQVQGASTNVWNKQSTKAFENTQPAASRWNDDSPKRCNKRSAHSQQFDDANCSPKRRNLHDSHVDQNNSTKLKDSSNKDTKTNTITSGDMWDSDAPPKAKSNRVDSTSSGHLDNTLLSDATWDSEILEEKRSNRNNNREFSLHLKPPVIDHQQATSNLGYQSQSLNVPDSSFDNRAQVHRSRFRDSSPANNFRNIDTSSGYRSRENSSPIQRNVDTDRASFDGPVSPWSRNKWQMRQNETAARGESSSFNDPKDYGVYSRRSPPRRSDIESFSNRWNSGMNAPEQNTRKTEQQNYIDSGSCWDDQSQSRKQKDESAYSPSSPLLDAVSSEDEIDFPERKQKKFNESLQSTMVSQNYMRDQREKNYLDDGTTNMRDALESLKHRAESLKQLEDVKQARQKLLTQIKQKQHHGAIWQHEEVDSFNSANFDRTERSHSRFSDTNPNESRSNEFLNTKLPSLLTLACTNPAWSDDSRPAYTAPHTITQPNLPDESETMPWQISNHPGRIDTSRPPPQVNSPLFCSRSQSSDSDRKTPNEQSFNVQFGRQHPARFQQHRNSPSDFNNRNPNRNSFNMHQQQAHRDNDDIMFGREENMTRVQQQNNLDSRVDVWEAQKEQFINQNRISSDNFNRRPDVQQQWNNDPRQQWNNDPRQQWNNDPRQQWNNDPRHQRNNDQRQLWDNEQRQQQNVDQRLERNNDPRQPWNNDQRQQRNFDQRQQWSNDQRQQWNNDQRQQFGGGNQIQSRQQRDPRNHFEEPNANNNYNNNAVRRFHNQLQQPNHNQPRQRQNKFGPHPKNRLNNQTNNPEMLLQMMLQGNFSQLDSSCFDMNEMDSAGEEAEWNDLLE